MNTFLLDSDKFSYTKSKLHKIRLFSDLVFTPQTQKSIGYSMTFPNFLYSEKQLKEIKILLTLLHFRK